MFKSPIAALVLGSAVATARAGSRRPTPPRNRQLQRREEFQRHLHGTSPRSARLRQKFLAKATPVGERQLQNNYNSNNQGDMNAYDRQASDYGFEPSNFALSYHRCAAVQQFDDDVAAGGGSGGVFATKSFAIFRFCPADTCDFLVEATQYQGAANDQAYDPQGNGNGYQYQGAANNQAYDQQGNGNGYQQGNEGNGNGYQYQGAANDQAYDQQGNGNGYQQGNGQGNGRRLTYGGGQYTQNSDGTVYGAQGKGCQKNYGEYMIELGDYLQLMLEHQQDRTEQYCAFCDNYMYEVYQEYVNQCNNQDNCRRRRKLEYEEFKKGPLAAHEHHRELASYDLGACSPYQDVCDGALDDAVTDYFECTATGNGFYVGPHCADDGVTVTLGAYTDAQCTQYADGVDASYYVGQSLQNDALKSWYNSKHGTLDLLFEGEEESLCIPCQQQDDEFDAMLEDGGQVNYSIDMSDVCQQVYDTSAHCHRHYKSFSKKSLSKLEYSEEQLNCDFIDSVVMGNYDEMGYVNLQSDWNYRDSNNNPEWAQDNVRAAQFVQSAKAVSPLQIFCLTSSLLACGLLAVWSKTLHSSLTKKEPWAPRREWHPSDAFRRPEPRPEPAGINPVDSGIGASRVRSDNSAYYLT